MIPDDHKKLFHEEFTESRNNIERVIVLGNLVRAILENITETDVAFEEIKYCKELFDLYQSK